MRIPAQMLPCNLWEAKCLNTLVLCQSCGSGVIVGNGIAFPVWFMHEESIYYGYRPFHDITCLLEYQSPIEETEH